MYKVDTYENPVGDHLTQIFAFFCCLVRIPEQAVKNVCIENSPWGRGGGKDLACDNKVARTLVGSFE